MSGLPNRGYKADEAFGGMVARMDMPPHAGAVSIGRGHRFAACPRCSTGAQGRDRARRMADELTVLTAVSGSSINEVALRRMPPRSS